MALVADYSGSSSEGEQDEEIQVPKPQAKVNETKVDVGDAFEHISDEDEGKGTLGSILDEVEESPTSGPGLGLGLVAPSVPAHSGKKDRHFEDTEEDLSDLPKATEAEKAAAPLRPKPKLPILGGAKRNRGRGPVKIMLPTLEKFTHEEENDDEPGGKKAKSLGKTAGISVKKSALLSMLPAPKTQTPQTLGGGKEVTAAAAKIPTKSAMLVPDSVARRRSAPTPKTKPKVVPDSDDSDDDQDGPANSFFTLDDKKSYDAASIPSSSSSVTVMANPHAHNPADRPLAFKHRDPEQLLEEEQPQAGPSSSSVSMVGPSLPTHHTGINAYPEPEDLLANEDALNRLAGSAALRNKEEFDVVDVKGSDLAADTREWLTKALTEDDTDKPGPRNTIKGEKKRKHQITYLAAVAKENEHKLKAQWATNFANKKAAGAKYGFF